MAQLFVAAVVQRDEIDVGKDYHELACTVHTVSKSMNPHSAVMFSVNVGAMIEPQSLCSIRSKQRRCPCETTEN